MAPKIELFDYQKKAVNDLKTGSILWGGVGSGKSLTSIAYFDKNFPKTIPLYIITTARKRDSQDWLEEAKNFDIVPIVDSWNNIGKYKKVKGAFFIFDEQKVVGSGAWVKSFIKISRSNDWILLSATPGDTWMDYIPVFVANGFYRNRIDFITQHVVYNTFTNYPKVDRFVDEGKLIKFKNRILVKMDYQKKTVDHVEKIYHPYDQELFNVVYEDRWNPYTNEPIKGASEACYILRKVVNSDPSRLATIQRLVKNHSKLIVFYNFDYELEILRRLEELLSVPVAEYNGHLHEDIPTGESWVYLAHYVSAGEAWNCTTSNAIALYSRSYSYKQTIQAMGRVDRQNTPFLNLYYYFLTSHSPIDEGIGKAYSAKKNFNEAKFLPKIGLA